MVGRQSLSPWLLAVAVSLAIGGGVDQVWGQDQSDSSAQESQDSEAAATSRRSKAERMGRPKSGLQGQAGPMNARRRMMMQMMQNGNGPAKGMPGAGRPGGPRPGAGKGFAGPAADRMKGPKGPQGNQIGAGAKGPKGQKGTAGNDDNAARLQQFRQRLLDADTNGDQQLSLAEAPEMLKQRFDQIDRNSDGQLDRQELTEMFRKMRERTAGAGATGGPGAKGAMTNGEAAKKFREMMKKNGGAMDRLTPPDGTPVKPIRPGKTD